MEEMNDYDILVKGWEDLTISALGKTWRTWINFYICLPDYIGIVLGEGQLLELHAAFVCTSSSKNSNRAKKRVLRNMTRTKKRKHKHVWPEARRENEYRSPCVQAKSIFCGGNQFGCSCGID